MYHCDYSTPFFLPGQGIMAAIHREKFKIEEELTTFFQDQVKILEHFSLENCDLFYQRLNANKTAIKNKIAALRDLEGKEETARCGHYWEPMQKSSQRLSSLRLVVKSSTDATLKPMRAGQPLVSQAKRREEEEKALVGSSSEKIRLPEQDQEEDKVGEEPSIGCFESDHRTQSIEDHNFRSFSSLIKEDEKTLNSVKILHVNKCSNSNRIRLQNPNSCENLNSHKLPLFLKCKHIEKARYYPKTTLKFDNGSKHYVLYYCFEIYDLMRSVFKQVSFVLKDSDYRVMHGYFAGNHPPIVLYID